jgi:hypothetical protein
VLAGPALADTAQTITFPELVNKATNAVPFALEATASSGLEVGYAVVSTGGVVTVSGKYGHAYGRGWRLHHHSHTGGRRRVCCGGARVAHVFGIFQCRGLRQGGPWLLRPAHGGNQK